MEALERFEPCLLRLLQRADEHSMERTVMA